MVSTFTQNLGLENPTPADPATNNVWGTTENEGRTLLDSAVSGIESLSVAGAANVLLTFNQGAPDQSRNQHFVLSGAITANIYTLWPAGKQRVFSVANNTTPGTTTVTGNVTAGSNIIPGIGSTTALVAGMPISGTGIPAGTTILSVDSGTQIHVSQLPTAGTGAGVVLTATYTLLAAVTNGSSLPAGTAVPIPNGFSMELVSDGTNVTERNSAITNGYAVIGSGTIDNTPIGGQTPAPVTCTNLTVTGTVTGITTVPPGTMAPTAAMFAPTGWLFCYGQVVSRVTFSTLFGVIALSTNGNVTAGSPIITGIVATTTGLSAGMPISGTGIPAATTILSVDSASQIHISQNANSGTGTSVAIQICPSGVGDGSTTFNLPDYRGRGFAGVDNMGGTAANRITAGGSGIAGTTLGATGGDQLLQAHGHGASASVSDPQHSHGPDGGGQFVTAGGGSAQLGGGSGINAVGSTALSPTNIGVSVTVNSAGAGVAQNMPPLGMSNIMIKT